MLIIFIFSSLTLSEDLDLLFKKDDSDDVDCIYTTSPKENDLSNSADVRVC